LKREGKTERLHVFYSFKNEEEQPGLEVLKSTVSESQLHLFSTRQKLANIENRRIIWRDIDKSGIDLMQSHFYICGNETFTSNFVENLKALNSENIYTDEW